VNGKYNKPMSSCQNTYYEYGIYAVLGTLLVASEALGITKNVKPNSLLDIVLGIVNGVIGKRSEALKKREELVTNNDNNNINQSNNVEIGQPTQDSNTHSHVDVVVAQ
jgi:hypothetical protein